MNHRTGNREQGTGNREQGTGNREQGIGRMMFLKSKRIQRRTTRLKKTHFSPTPLHPYTPTPLHPYTPVFLKS
ncbi:hypothetical protein SD80_028640 [Scytonema tolypothrichoides VB-61278]|nr:hypothetical protein SD80_028640 [Scytonema tolypothrichoides VB-61278]